MKPTETMRNTRNAGNYIASSVHYTRRRFDGRYEIVAQATASFLNANELNIGGEIVLDVQKNRQDAVDAVRYFRKHETA